MARFTNEQIIKALRESRGLVAVAARKLGCARQTIYNRAEKSEAVREALVEAREFTTDIAEAALYKAIEAGEGWAVCFYLKTQGKGRGYIERQEHEVSGPSGGPVEVVVTRRVIRPDGDDRA